MHLLLLPGVGAMPARLSGDVVLWLRSAVFLRLALWSSALQCARLVDDRPVVKCYACIGIL